MDILQHQKKMNLLRKRIIPVVCLFLFLIIAFACTGQDDDHSFTLVVIPDTQIYCKNDHEWRRSARKEVFFQMTDWIARNAEAENIVFAFQVGDIVTDYDDTVQWEIASGAMGRLDGIVPYCMVVGNHDIAMGGDNNRESKLFNTYFPYQRYEQEPWYGGRMDDDGFLPKDNNDNTYHLFSAGDMNFLVIALEVAPTDKMLAWADSVIRRYPDRKVIFVTHSYLDGDDTRDEPGGYGYLPPGEGNTGEEIWQKLVRKHPNMFLVINGHHASREDHQGFLESRGDHGNKVFQLFSSEEHDGWFRLVRFYPEEGRFTVRSYSPWKPESPSQQLHQYPFSLPGYNPSKFRDFEVNFKN